MAKAKVANWRRSKRHAKEEVLLKGRQIQPAKSAILYLDLRVVRR
jgi:ribosomal protein L35AE/L33A